MDIISKETDIAIADVPQKLKILALDEVFFPNVSPLTLAVNDESWFEEIMAQGGYFLVVLKKNDEATNGADKYFKIGTSVVVTKKTRDYNNKLGVEVRGLYRFRIRKISGEYALGENLPVDEEKIPEAYEGTIGQLRKDFLEYGIQMFADPEDLVPDMPATQAELSQLLDFVASKLEDVDSYRTALKRQEFLEILDVYTRLIAVFKYLKKQLVSVGLLLKTEKDVQAENIREGNLDHLLRVRNMVERKLAVFGVGANKQIPAKTGNAASDKEAGDDYSSYKDKLSALNLPAEAKAEAERELQRLTGLRKDSAEYAVVATYLNWMTSLPWNTTTEDNLDIRRAKEILDADHYGLDYAKDTILEYLSVQNLGCQRKKDCTKGNILLFVGPPGTGKTSLGASIARAMNRKFIRFSLGGLRDEAEIKGHRRTYIGAMPGKIIELMKRVGTKNPVIMLDEVDKIGKDFRGDPADILLEVLDPEQNFAFSDHYLGVPFDLSRVMFILTANDASTISGPIKDRTEKVYFSSYTTDEKLHIAKTHLMPKQIRENHLEPGEIEFSDEAIGKIISDYTREAGVRSLEKQIQRICRKVVTEKVSGQDGTKMITPEAVKKYLGVEKFSSREKLIIDQPGIVCGLAWTAVGGTLLYIETSAAPGSGRITQTGKLGDVMTQSITVAEKYIAAHAQAFNIIKEYFGKKKDIHLHVPDGATPKDGPSAGITILTALISLMTGIKADSDTAMTGEITLRGDILPVGGIKEKIIVAHREGLKRIILPADCRKMVEQDVPQKIREALAFHYVTKMDEALEIALGKSIYKKPKVEDKKEDKKD